MIDIIIKISTIFVMIAIGYAACKCKFIKYEAQSHLASLILHVNIPCMLLYSITQNEVSHGMMRVTVATLVCSFVYFIIAAAASIPLVKAFHVKENNDKGVYQVIFTSVNAGFIGFPVTQLIFGNEILYFMALHNIVLNVYLYSLCVMQLNGIGGGCKSGISILKKMVNPCIISAAVSILLLFAGVRLPGYVNGIIGPIGDATIPMAMLLIGIQLSEGNIAQCITNVKMTLFSVIRLFFWPAAVLLVMVILPAPDPMKIVLTLGAALPPASTISALAANEGRNYQLAANGIIVTTLLSILSIPCSVLMIHTFL